MGNHVPRATSGKAEAQHDHVEFSGRICAACKEQPLMDNDQLRTIINTLTSEPAMIYWQFPCNDDGEMHTNFALNYAPADFKDYDEKKHGWIIWHNCSHEMGFNSPLTRCCACHSPLPEGRTIISGAAYIGCEFSNDDEMVERAMTWAKEKGIL